MVIWSRVGIWIGRLADGAGTMVQVMQKYQNGSLKHVPGLVIELQRNLEMSPLGFGDHEPRMALCGYVSQVHLCSHDSQTSL